MLYDFTSPYDCERAKARLQSLIDKQAQRIEITERRQRTDPQNRYLHVCIGIVAMETGNTLEYAKQQYFKLLVNPDIFIEEHYDKVIGKTTRHLISSASVSKEDMTTAITRFRNWASRLGLYIPSPEEEYMIRQAEAAIQRNKEYL